MSPPPFKVKAVYDYSSPHEEDLNFDAGQIITVTEEEDADWYTGEYQDASGAAKSGIFPRNFVEKYEPVAPPRPVRAPRPPVQQEEPTVTPAAAPPPPPEPAPVQEPELEEAAPEPEEEPEPAPEPPKPEPPKPQVQSAVKRQSIQSPAPPSPAPYKPAEPVTAPRTIPPPRDEPKQASESPAAAPKPTGNSFKDRIAAFNKSAAPPPVPFKPGGNTAASFIKKPFVAPPPSRNAYVPPPREPPPTKLYRREEDPEIAAKESENQEQAERAGLVPTESTEEDQPKRTSLKERIALLQKQQMEQAARHAEAAQKKEKPKRPPPKKRTESHEQPKPAEEGEGAELSKNDSQETISATKKSMDSTREEFTSRPVPRRKSTKGSISSRKLPEGDGNEADMSGAGETTEEPEELSTGHNDTDEKRKSRAPPPPARAPAAPLQEPDVGEEEGAVDEEDEAEEEEEEEEDIDPEARRREEIRARMAKMSGGMGMHGMFGPPGGMPMPAPVPPKKKKSSDERRPSEHVAEAASPVLRAPPVPMMALPGMSALKSPEELNSQLEPQEQDEEEPAPTSITNSAEPDEVRDMEDIKPVTSHSTHSRRSMDSQGPRRSVDSHREELGHPPPIPGGRPAPPPVPADTRPSQYETPLSPMTGEEGDESDDEVSGLTRQLTIDTPRGVPPPPPGAPAVPVRPSDMMSPMSPANKRASYLGAESSPTSPPTPGVNRRLSRGPPPIPGVAPSGQPRAPPPPPPGPGGLSRSSTATGDVLPPPVPMSHHEEEDEEVTEYDGDYDTDIASGVPHKEALKSHHRDSSIDDDNTPSRTPAPAPRAVPPPPPSNPPRQSTDMPRAAPPPPPPAHEADYAEEDGEGYDPYRYTSPPKMPSKSAATSPSIDNEDFQFSPPTLPPAPPQERAAPPPPPHAVPPPPTHQERPMPPQVQAARAPGRASVDVQRTASIPRRSVEMSRMSLDSGFIANDIDLSPSTLWWTSSPCLPPALASRRDILYESEESVATKRGGKTVVTKDIYVLFPDYSQTVITAAFDKAEPSDCSLMQRHEQPPKPLRQDQLEAAWEKFGRRIAEQVQGKQGERVGDGTASALINEMLSPFKEVLRPVGMRSFGALVYANLANASVVMHDEIRAGDVVTFRNARFQGKHGSLHQKYSVDVGMVTGGNSKDGGSGGNGEGHVGVVAEWDGTKKKVRVWEQGREKGKVKMEGFRLDDLRSGEVRIWRVMGRGWVGWEGDN